MMLDTAFRPLPWIAPDISVDRRDDGSILLWSNHAPGEAPQSIAHLLADRAAAHPDRPFIRQRLAPGGAWRTLSYGEAQHGADSIAQALLDRGMTPHDTVLVLSGNSIEHALIMLGCYAAGVPVAPISPALSLASTDHAKLRHCAAMLKPRMVFVQSGNAFSRALETLGMLEPAPLVVTADDDGPAGSLSFSALLATAPDPAAIRAARDGLSHRTVAKYLLTSGSTGIPKAVPQTHGMMAATIAALDGLTDDAERAHSDVVSEILEWMPWSHASAGNIGFNDLLWKGGTLYLDDGRPVPGLFETTIANLHDVVPVTFGSAPIAFAMLADVMERDPALRTRFFSKLRYMTYGGATLSDDVYRRLQALAVAETGHRVPLMTMYGSTETQGITMTHWITERAGLVGLPLPGITLKLVPNGVKLEVRVKGPTVTPGYVGAAATAASSFDEEGYYKLGDAVRFVDDSDPAQGLVFDGRVAEDFKLDSGTWVSVGTLRPAVVTACSPLVQDAVIVGHDRRFLGALIWLSAAARAMVADSGDRDDLVAAIRERLLGHNHGKGSAQRIARVVFLETPPSIDAGEITDKGSINQAAAIACRSVEIDALYSEPPPPSVIVI